MADSRSSSTEIRTVLLTGATGFVGAHVLDALLRRGLRVRCTARSFKKAERMLADRPAYRNQLEVAYVRDLSLPGVFDDAVKGVDAIVHTASPVYYDIQDNEKELMIPAVVGTQSVLSAARREPRVRRVVLTSSFAAVLDPAQGARPGYVYTAADWNPIAYADGARAGAPPLDGYRAGKKFAELAAWEAVHAAGAGAAFDVVALCPPMVFGPVVHPVARLAELNDSNADLWGITQRDPLPAPRVPCWVDVRDLAAAHVAALVRPGAGNRRYTVAAPGHFSYQRAADIARAEFAWARTAVTKGEEGAPLPEAYCVDGETAARELGVTYRPFEETVIDAMRQFRQIQLQEQ